MAERKEIGAAPKKLTQEFVNAVPPPADKSEGGSRWYSDGEADKGLGQLLLRVGRAGTKRWYFRYPLGDGRRRGVPIGPADGKAGLTLAAARKVRDDLRNARRHGDRDVGATLKAQAIAEKAKKVAEKLAAEKTLQSLLDLYGAHLTAQGKSSAKDAKNIMRLHLSEAHPAIARKPAATITPQEITSAMRRLVEAGKDRTAGKLRSCIAAAYTMALHAETDAHAPAAMRGFALTGNPALATKAIPIGVRERNLSETELRAVLPAIGALPDSVHKDALMVALLLGGQRPTQLLRLRVDEVDLQAGSILLRDPKGKRSTPRLHALPLSGEALRIVKRLHKRSLDLGAPWIFTATGTHQLGIEEVSKSIAGISEKLLSAKTIDSAFTLGDMRRTCETQLAALGVSKDVRAQLLSHGLSGVQQRHYDKHEYMPEKKKALVAWTKKMTALMKAKPQKVAAKRAKRAAA